MRSFIIVFLVGFALLVGCQADSATSETAANLEQSVVPEQPARIVFVSDRDGDFDIYVMDHDGSNLTALTDNRVNDAMPAWSPEAEALAYVNRLEKGGMAISRMKIDGSEQTVVIEKPPLIPIPLVWNATGEWLAFGSGAAAEVYVINSSGDTLRNLSNDPGRDDFQAWSPGGSQILFTSKRDGSQAIYVVEIEGGEPARLTELDSNSGQPDWSPDGTRIAFMSDRDGGDVEIFLMDADGRNLTRLTNSPGFDGYPAWSPDGSKIAFSSLRDGNNEIYVMKADGSDQINLTNSPDSQEAIRGDFAWSSDGSQILFHSDRDGSADVFVMDDDGSHQINLTNNPATDFSAIWVQ
jgi:Tol biopolymer transport system component